MSKYTIGFIWLGVGLSAIAGKEAVMCVAVTALCATLIVGGCQLFLAILEDLRNG